MEIGTSEKESRQIPYESDLFEKLLSEIENKTTLSDLYLILLTGNSDGEKEDALNQIKKRTDRNFVQVDANKLFSANEAETARRVDVLFEETDSDDTVIHVVNGANLCGAFTGYTLSKVKYATPQERHFLKKAKESNAFLVIDFESIDEVDSTLQRASRSIVTFPAPNSGLKGLLARLKEIHVNGYNLSSKRPEKKELIKGNF